MNLASKKSVTIILILIFIFALPVSTKAQVTFKAADTIPPVPISDAAQREKEVGITIFGITLPGITLDMLVMTIIVKPLIHTIVTDTIHWANTGFSGQNPLYATDPLRYFTKMADNVAGKFIEGSDLGLLCTPFQAKIRLALLSYYRQPTQYQCSLTQVVGNIEGFYNNFSEGGWDGWFAMTQNDVNNPYGAYLTAKVDLDSRIAQKLNIADKELSWNDQFLNQKDCIEYEMESGECLEFGPTVTPGKQINNALENALDTELDQLELADEFDELLIAVISGLLKRTINSVQGVFR